MSVFTVLEKLVPHIKEEVNLILISKQEARTLESKLEQIHDGLQEAERYGVTDKNVKRWLGQLEDLMNEMDDTLDQWETNNIQLQMEQSELENFFDRWEKVYTLLLSVWSSFKHVVGRRNLTKEMIALSGKLDKILEEKGKYNFVSSNSTTSSQLEIQETSSFIDKSKVHGREDDTDKLVDFLLGKGDGALVVSVVGSGGLGKTTLAQLVYNDDRVKQHFGRFKAWVSVPDPFDALPVAKAILATFDKTSVVEYTLEALEQRIKAIVSRKNFLLVLDNVGTVDRRKWESLANFFVGETGFRILVTTRNENTARTVDTNHLQRLDFLSDSDCAAILNKIALKDARGEEHEEFLEIGLEIAKKCNGLPLAAKTIGYALASRSTIKEWRDVLESPLWKYEDEMSDILRPLRLSYMDLSPLLKRCFLSSVLYSKGFNFDSRGLNRIWMAQHYVDLSVDSDHVDPKGEEHLKKLSERSFFQVSGRNDEGEPTYKMHDIMYDFATHLSGSEYYIIIDGRTDKRPYRMPTHGKTRYFCARFVSQKDLPRNLFKLLKCARVLCLSDCEFEEFSEDLGKFIHLRYLDLSGNLMKELPENVTNLYNLQTLDLRRCRNLIKLPLGLKKLMKLRHLLISETESLLEFPDELRKLTGVWSLYGCSATRDSLTKSNQLVDSLNIDSPEMDQAEKFQLLRFSNTSFTCPSLIGCLPLFTRYDAAEDQSPDMICYEEPIVAAADGYEAAEDQSPDMICYEEPIVAAADGYEANVIINAESISMHLQEESRGRVSRGAKKRRAAKKRAKRRVDFDNPESKEEEENDTIVLSESKSAAGNAAEEFQWQPADCELYCDIFDSEGVAATAANKVQEYPWQRTTIGSFNRPSRDCNPMPLLQLNNLCLKSSISEEEKHDDERADCELYCDIFEPEGVAAAARNEVEESPWQPTTIGSSNRNDLSVGNIREEENYSIVLPVSGSAAGNAAEAQPHLIKYLNNVRSLEINGSQYSHLPQLENLPMLVTLRIQKMDFRALTLGFFFGGFPKLETLTFSECQLWEEWEDLEKTDEQVKLPRLDYLAITLCPKLKALPHRLLRASTSLQELFVAGCPLLAAAYDKEMGGDNWDQISQIPNTIILADY